MTSLSRSLTLIRAAGEETRLRILVLLLQGELTVTELTDILSQSQPRVSRHLKILTEAGLVERYQESTWVFYRLATKPAQNSGLQEILDNLSGGVDPTVRRDMDRLGQIRAARAAKASVYFQDNAAEWDQLRKLHLPEQDIEREMLSLAGPRKIGHFVDLGTGTGQMLVLFQNIYESATGFDVSRDMLAFARSRLEEDGLTHAMVRQADLHALPLTGEVADFVCIHQVLHYLADPGKAVKIAGTLLKPGGRLLIADFASHEMEFLREKHAHRRLGFSQGEVENWCAASGLDCVQTRTLAPGRAESGKLTVKLWLLAKPVEAGRNLKKQDYVDAT